MAVRLKIPAVVEKPLIPAETRPQKIAQFIHSLPAANPVEATTTLLEELENMNRQALASDVRLKALEIYRPAVTNLAEHLASQYCNAPLPLPVPAKKAATAAESLWQELGYGYKLALIDQQGKLFTLGGTKASALILQRAIEAMSQLAMVYYQTYVTPPGSLWQDLHQLYLHAAQESLLDLEVEKDDRRKSTVNLTYKQALLMSLADPQHMPASDIRLVADYIERHAQHSELQGLGVLENPAGVFIVRLNSDQAPIPYAKIAKQTDPNHDILLITVDLARLIHTHLKLLPSGEAPGMST